MTHEPFRPDPRLLLLLTALYSPAIWKASPVGLAMCVALFGLFRLVAGSPLMPPGGMARAARFALLWTALKVLVDALGLHTGGLSFVSLDAMPGILSGAGLLGLRLFLLLLLGLGLTTLVSAPAMGAALIHLLPPPLRRHCWTIGPTLAFMARCLPEILAAAHETRLGARARGLPDKGPAFWKLALPQIFRLPALRVHALATAAAVRGFEAPEAWTPPRNRNSHAFLLLFLAAGFVVWLV